MTTSPSHSVDDLILRHAAGALDAAFALLVETHLDMSPAARRLSAQFESLGGALLDEIAPADVDPDALNRALQSLDAQTPAAPVRATRAAKRLKLPKGFELPAPLADADIGPWRWIAPGVRSARVALPKPSLSRAFLLEIAPGVRVPRHGHEGDEATCVLRGGFRDGAAHFGAGDVAHVDEATEHDILVDPAVPCLCLIAMEGRTRPASWIGRLYQKFRDI
jgi:putative transcriptional regulator